MADAKSDIQADIYKVASNQNCDRIARAISPLLSQNQAKTTFFHSKVMIVKGSPVSGGLGTDHLLDEGMVGGVHAGAQRVKTFPITVVGRVACRGQHPVLKEVQVKRYTVTTNY